MVNGKYDYHQDAVNSPTRLPRSGLPPRATSVLIWIDADIITHAQVTTEWLDRLMPLSATVGWIGRATKYPETGFMLFACQLRAA